MKPTQQQIDQYARLLIARREALEIEERLAALRDEIMVSYRSLVIAGVDLEQLTAVEVSR